MTVTDLLTGRLSGDRIAAARKTVGDLRDYWLAPQEIANAEELLYETQTFQCADGEAEGVVLWGNTTLMPGEVGRECFMTRGHRHVKTTHGELCITVSGSGLLLLMDEDRNTRAEPMQPGSTHWINGGLAHRTVNCGDEPLVFLCAWPADCGHDYGEIAERGFSLRALKTSDGIELSHAD